jgi:hypothetical protein
MVMEFNTFIDDLIKNVNIDNVPREIDLVLDGGAFNGGYQLGALIYLKQMEKKKIIKIKRISGTSVGSILGFLFIIDHLEYALEKNYEVWRNFRKNFNLSIVREMIIEFMTLIDKNIYKKLNKKLFITYFNVNKKKQIVKSTYKNNNQIQNSIIKSCFVPYLIDGNYTYKNKYIDGVYPYLFKYTWFDYIIDKKNNFINNERIQRKILFICLSSFKQLKMMNIKNEINGHERILYGIMDINKFFKNNAYNKKYNTQMCSYLDNWRFIDWIYFRFRYIFIIIILYIAQFYTRFNFNSYNNISNIFDFIKRYIGFTLKNIIV